MTTEEIRLRIIKEQVNYQNAVESMKKSAEEIQQILSEFTEEDIQKLTSVGINAQMLVSVDTDRCVGDSEYLNQMMQEYERAIRTLHKFLEEELNV